MLNIYKDQWIVEQRHRDLKQTLRVRPVFLHNDDRIEALIAIIGIALLIFGLIEADLRASLGDGVPLPGILPEGRAAIPTARAVLAAFDGLHLTYTPGRHRPGPAHPGPANDPRPPQHPAALARETRLITQTMTCDHAENGVELAYSQTNIRPRMTFTLPSYQDDPRMARYSNRVAIARAAITSAHAVHAG